jgi:hypothetical protein
MSLVRRASLRLRYHRRRCGCKSGQSSSPDRLDCCTGRARLEDREPLRCSVGGCVGVSCADGGWV